MRVSQNSKFGAVCGAGLDTVEAAVAPQFSEEDLGVVWGEGGRRYRVQREL